MLSSSEVLFPRAQLEVIDTMVVFQVLLCSLALQQIKVSNLCEVEFFRNVLTL